MNTGALHSSFVRQLMTPLPYSAPITNAAFLTSGKVITQRARSQYSFGTIDWMSCTTLAADARRAASDEVIAASAPTVAARTTPIAHRHLFIKAPLTKT